MRKLEYRNPYKARGTKLGVAEMVNKPADHYFEKSSCCMTPFGIVMVYEMNWKHNNGKDYFTLFQTVHKGMVHSAYLSEANLSAIQSKWLATNFIKTVTKQQTTKP